MSDELTVETVEHVRVLRLDRPERKNALTSSLGWKIVRALGDAQRDDDVRVVALTGNGDAFCSGLDLGGGKEHPPDTGLSEQQRILDEKGWVGRFLVALRFETDKPVVAGINGVAVGAGLSLAMAADIVVAADQLEARLLELLQRDRRPGPAGGALHEAAGRPSTPGHRHRRPGDRRDPQRAHRLEQRGRAGSGAGDHGEARTAVPGALIRRARPR